MQLKALESCESMDSSVRTLHAAIMAYSFGRATFSSQPLRVNPEQAQNRTSRRSLFRGDFKTPEIQGAHHAVPIGATAWHRRAEVAVGARPIAARTIVPCGAAQNLSMEGPSRVQETAGKNHMLQSLRSWQDAGHNPN